MRKYWPWISLMIGFIVLYFISINNYLIFHMFTEVFTFLIAGAVFVITINARKYFKNSYLVFLGITYLFISILDLFHTMTYTGMPFSFVSIFKGFLHW